MHCPRSQLEYPPAKLSRHTWHLPERFEYTSYIHDIGTYDLHRDIRNSPFGENADDGRDKTTRKLGLL